MSLTVTALRVCLTRALRGRTLAGGRVLDSEMAALAAAKQGPAIVVYSDDLELQEDATLLSNRGDLSMAIGVMVTSLTETEEPGAYAVTIPPTDAGLELVVDLICRQILSALADPDNIWAERFKRMALSWRVTALRRGSNAREGLRLAGREIALVVRPVADPAPGAELTAAWASLIQALDEETDDDAQAWAAILVDWLAAETPRDPAAALVALLGMSREDAEALLRGPADLAATAIEPAAPGGV